MPAPASEDDLKRRARRRLIGAVALMLVAVIVLPLLLEDEPPPSGRLDVKMPPAVAQAARTLAPQTAPPVATATAPAPTPVETAAPPLEMPQAPPHIAKQSDGAGSMAHAPVERKPVEHKPVEHKPVEHKPVERKPVEHTPVETARPAETVRPEHAVRKPAEAGTPLTEHAETPTGKPAFVVQLGAFSSSEKGAALKARAMLLGMPGYTDKAGALTRVRVGPFATHAAAEQAANKLAANGMPGQVVEK